MKLNKFAAPPGAQGSLRRSSEACLYTDYSASKPKIPSLFVQQKQTKQSNIDLKHAVKRKELKYYETPCHLEEYEEASDE